jgi:WD40 repeat protein
MSTQKNPFVGLRTFESDESLLFFGRQQQTIELLEHLHRHHFVAVVGSSGSGKSSLIRAGLIPRLKAGYLIQERDSWMMAVMKPGQAPLYNLAEAIVTGINNNAGKADVQALVQKIGEAGEDVLVTTLEPLWTVHNKNIFILVDQFEELFRYSGEINTAERKNGAIDFVNILLSLASELTLPIYIVITLRSDFIGECAQFYGLPEAMNKSQYLVPRLNRTQLKNAITGPVAITGATITPNLINLLLNDIGDDQDQLPILQHALMRTFDVWKEKDTDHQPIDIEDYRQIGTMKHALSQHAEEAFSELTAREHLICEKMFKALTDKRIGTKGTRHPQTFRNLLLITGATETELTNVINVFRKSGRAFIMPLHTVHLTPNTVIDISHESLMRVWERLQGWVEEESESKQIYLRLSEAAELYAQGKGGLWRNPELQIALFWKGKNAPNVAWAAQVNSSFEQTMQFLELSQQHTEQEIKEKEQEQRRRLNNLRKTVATITLIAIASIWLMVYAFNQRGEAIEQRKKALQQQLKADKNAHKADSLKSIAEGALRDFVYATRSEQAALSSKDSALYQKHIADSLTAVALAASVRAIQSQQEALRQKDAALMQKQRADSAAQQAEQALQKAKESEEQAKQSKATTETLKNLADSKNLAIKAISQINADLIQDSKSSALQAYEKNRDNNGPLQNVTIFKALYVNWIAAINNTNQFDKHKYPVRCITGSNNKIFTADEGGKIYVSEIDQTALKPTSSHDIKSEIRALAVSADGTKLAAIAAHDKGFLFNIAGTGELTQAATFNFTGTCKSALSGNNGDLFILSTAGITKFDNQHISQKPDFYPESSSKAMYVSSSGHIYLAFDRDIFVYNNWDDLKNGLRKAVLSLNNIRSEDHISSLAVDVNEQYIAAGTSDGRITIASLKHDAARQTIKLHQSRVNDLKFAYVTGNKLQLASAGADNTIKLIDVESFLKTRNTEEIIVLEGHDKWVYQLFYNQDGKLLFSCGEDNKVMIWKPTMTDLYQTLQ